METEDELLGDFRPGFTLWRKRLPDQDVLVAQLEGGELISEDVREGLSMMRQAIQASRCYTTLYDLSLQTFEAGALLPHAPSLLAFAAEMRSAAAEKQRCMIAVCTDERARNWIRWILSVLSQKVRYYIFQSSDEAWAHIRQPTHSMTENFDAFGHIAGLPTSLATLTLGDAPLL